MAWVVPSPPSVVSHSIGSNLVAPAAQVHGRAVAAVVLHGAVHVERGRHVVGHVEELHHRQGPFLPGDLPPRAALVVREHHAAVVAVDQHVGVGGVDPQGVVIAVHVADALERLPAVGGLVEREREEIHDVLVGRVHAHLGEHPPVGGGGALHVGARLAHLAPGRAAVVAAVDLGAADRPRPLPAVRVQLARLRLPRNLVVVHEGVEDVRLGPDDVDADPAPELRPGQAGVDRLPRRAAVGRLVDAALLVVGLVARIVPLPAHALPHGGVQHVRVLRVHREVVGARPRVDVEHLLPGPAPVDRLEHAAVLVVGPLAAAGRHVHDRRVGRVNDDAGDRVRRREAHVLPALPRVGGLVDPGPGVRAAEDVGFTRAEPDRVGVRRRHRHVAALGGRPLVEDRLEARALVLRLPQAARGGGDVDHAGLPRAVGDIHVHDAPADVGRAEQLPLQSLERRCVLHRLELVERLDAGIRVHAGRGRGRRRLGEDRPGGGKRKPDDGREHGKGRHDAQQRADTIHETSVGRMQRLHVPQFPRFNSRAARSRRAERSITAAV